MSRVLQGWEIAEYVQQVATLAKGVDQRGVGRRSVFARVTVLDQVDKSLRLLVVGAGLPVEEPEQPLARRAEEVIAAVVRGFGERRNEGGPLEDGGQRVAGVSAEVQNRLTGVEALDQQQVDP